MTGPAGDRGLPNERTLLAWVRTALALTGCALLLARLLRRHPDAAAAAALLGLAVAGLLSARAAQRYRSRKAAMPAAEAVLAPELVLAVAAAAGALAAAALLAVLTAG